MEPIIAPSTFYWINVISTLSTISISLFIFNAAALVIALIGVIDFIIENEFKGDFRKLCKKIIIILTIITTVFGLSCVFIPSKETLIAMTVAKYVTSDNIEAIGGTVEDSISYITSEVIQIIDAAGDKEEATKSE